MPISCVDIPIDIDTSYNKEDYDLDCISNNTDSSNTEEEKVERNIPIELIRKMSQEEREEMFKSLMDMYNPNCTCDCDQCESDCMHMEEDK